MHLKANRNDQHVAKREPKVYQKRCQDRKCEIHVVAAIDYVLALFCMPAGFQICAKTAMGNGSGNEVA